MKQKIILPSLIASNLCQINTEIKTLITAGADMIHIDVMDNHYVPNLTLGPLITKSIKENNPTVKQDVHLMVTPIDSLIESFAKAGADQITIHPESTNHLNRSITLIKNYNCKVGIALNPSTPISVLDHILDDIDLILIMSVNPGFGGQKFIKNSIKKSLQIQKKISTSNSEISIYIDGGINEATLPLVKHLDGFIIGTGLFSTKDYKQKIQKFRSILES